MACIYKGKPRSLRREHARQRSEALDSWRDPRLDGDLWQGSGVRREERVDLKVGRGRNKNAVGAFGRQSLGSHGKLFSKHEMCEEVCEEKSSCVHVGPNVL